MDNEAKRDQLAAYLKYGIAVLALAVFMPVIFLALQGMLGLLALGVAGAVGFTMIKLAPVFAMKVANWKMKLIVGEAEKNPIETLQNVYVERTQEYNQKAQELEDWDTEIRNFDDQAQGFKREYPEDTYQNDQYEEISKAMHEGLKSARLDHADAQKDLEVLAIAIKKAKAIYKMALATQKVTQFSKDAEAKVFQDIKTQVAFDSVRSNLNRSFARLNTAMAQRQQRAIVQPPSQKVLPAASEPKVIDITPEKAKVPVQRKGKEGQ